MGVTGNALGNNGGRLYSFGSQPVLIDCNFVIDSTNGNGLGVRSLKGQGVENVFMHTSASPGKGANGYLNPNPAAGYALIQLSSNYNRYLGGFSGFVSPLTGSPIAINSGGALTVGQAYVIVSPGHGPAGTATITSVADVSGSLASKYFTLYDSYGDSFVIWFSVSGVGSPPLLGPAAAYGQRGVQYVQQSIASGSSAATIAAALVLTIENLPSPVVGQLAFTASAIGAVVTVVSTLNQPLGGIPQDGSTVIPDRGPSVPIYFTLSPVGSATAGSIWTDGSGHLYSVTQTLVSGSPLVTSGVGAPIGSTLTYVSGPGSTAALTFTGAVTGWATGFAFALTVSDTNLQDWNAVGLQKGLIPTIGQSFIATSTGAGGSTGLVEVPGFSGINSIEVVGDPNTTFAPMPQGGSPNVGAWILVQMLSNGVLSAPVNGSVCGMSFYVDYRFSPSNVGL
jgi:hypothetical protein